MRRDERGELELRAHVGELAAPMTPAAAFKAVDDALAPSGERAHRCPTPRGRARGAAGRTTRAWKLRPAQPAPAQPSGSAAQPVRTPCNRRSRRRPAQQAQRVQPHGAAAIASSRARRLDYTGRVVRRAGISRRGCRREYGRATGYGGLDKRSAASTARPESQLRRCQSSPIRRRIRSRAP